VQQEGSLYNLAYDVFLFSATDGVVPCHVQ